MINWLWLLECSIDTKTLVVLKKLGRIWSIQCLQELIMILGDYLNSKDISLFIISMKEILSIAFQSSLIEEKLVPLTSFYVT